MAAVRVDVLRRGGFGGHVSKDQGVVRKDGFGVLVSRVSGFDFRDEKRDLTKFRKATSPGLEDGEIVLSCDDVEHMPLAKKRKCSPGGDAIKSDSSNVISTPLAEEEQRGDEHDKLCVGDDGEVVGARKLALSRWASDNDDEDKPAVGALNQKSSPESGSRSLSSDGNNSVKSVGRDDDAENGYENNGPMGVDRKQCDQSSTCQMDSVDEDGEIEEEAVDASRGCVNMLQGCRSVYEYEYLNAINEGAYGKVFKARDKKTGELVALKKVKMDSGSARKVEEYCFPITALREINILMSFNHPSIVNVKEVVVDDHDGVFMVMEYMEHDLKSLMEGMKYPFSTSEVKCLMLQLLEGVKYLHDNWVLHRDLKTSNVLLNNKGELKLCDFGMSRQYGSPLKPYTSLVVTLWYRAPELLLGAKQYSTAVDMWSVGCIMAELLAKEPLFKGTKEIDQLDKIIKVLGTPTEQLWPKLSKLPGAKAKFAKQPYNLLRKKFPSTSFTGSAVLSDSGLDLLNKLLTYDPEKRITVDEALVHPWFNEVPLPKAKEFMSTFPPQYVSCR